MMDSSVRLQQDESLNESWVELHYQQTPVGDSLSDLPADVQRSSIYNGNMEKLLIDAQCESSRNSSKGNSNSSSRGSPRATNSPVEPPTDWIWDWSSRMESQPPSDWGKQFRHPARSRLSMRNTRVMKSSLFSLENLPALLVTHACTFFLGAAAMFIYMKKYCNWAAVAKATSQ